MLKSLESNNNLNNSRKIETKADKESERGREREIIPNRQTNNDDVDDKMMTMNRCIHKQSKGIRNTKKNSRVNAIFTFKHHFIRSNGIPNNCISFPFHKHTYDAWILTALKLKTSIRNDTFLSSGISNVNNSNTHSSWMHIVWVANTYK